MKIPVWARWTVFAVCAVWGAGWVTGCHDDDHRSRRQSQYVPGKGYHRYGEPGFGNNGGGPGYAPGIGNGAKPGPGNGGNQGYAPGIGNGAKPGPGNGGNQGYPPGIGSGVAPQQPGGVGIGHGAVAHQSIQEDHFGKEVDHPGSKGASSHYRQGKIVGASHPPKDGYNEYRKVNGKRVLVRKHQELKKDAQPPEKK
jgi:hypothetical protein